MSSLRMDNNGTNPSLSVQVLITNYSQLCDIMAKVRSTVYVLARKIVNSSWAKKGFLRLYVGWILESYTIHFQRNANFPCPKGSDRIASCSKWNVNQNLGTVTCTSHKEMNWENSVISSGSSEIRRAIFG